MMDTPHEGHAARLMNWRQTAERRIATPDDAANLIDELGLVTLFPVSPETPNLFPAYMGDPTAETDSGHDKPLW